MARLISISSALSSSPSRSIYFDYRKASRFSLAHAIPLTCIFILATEDVNLAVVA